MSGAGAPPIWPPSDAARVQFVLLTHLSIARQRLIALRDAAERAGWAGAGRAINIAANTVGEQYETARTQTFTLREGGELPAPDMAALAAAMPVELT